MKSWREYEKNLECEYPAISRARKKRRLSILLKFLLLEALAVFLIVTSRGGSPVLWLLTLVPVLLAKPHKAFLGGYVGRVCRRDFFVIRKVKGIGTGRWGSKNVGRAGAVSMMTLSVMDEKGRIRRIDLPQRYQDLFLEGDALLVLSGLPYPIILSKKEKAFCPLCGTLTPYETGFCGGLCGMPLLELSE